MNIIYCFSSCHLRQLGCKRICGFVLAIINTANKFFVMGRRWGAKNRLKNLVGAAAAAAAAAAVGSVLQAAP